jgi:hypothetical protein
MTGRGFDAPRQHRRQRDRAGASSGSDHPNPSRAARKRPLVRASLRAQARSRGAGHESPPPNLMKRTARTRPLLSSTDSSGNGVSHGQSSCQEHPVADALENRWNVDHRVPSGFGAVRAGAKNGYAGISGKPVALILEVSLPICGLCGTGFTLPASRH